MPQPPVLARRDEPAVASVAKVGQDAVVVGQLHLICRHDAEQLAVGGMPYSTESRPRREHIVESPIGIHGDRRKRIAVRPGMSRCSVAGNFPRVVEDQTRCSRGAASREHSDLIGIGSGIEIATQQYRIAPTGGLRNELGELVDLPLANTAGIEWVIQHDGEEFGYVLVRPRLSLPAPRRIPNRPLLAAFAVRRSTEASAKPGRCPKPNRPAPNHRGTDGVPHPAAGRLALPAWSRCSTRTRPGRQCRGSPRPACPRSPFVAPATARSDPRRSRSRPARSFQQRVRTAHIDRNSRP